MSEGYNKFKETGEKLKGQVKQEEEKKEEERKVAISQLDIIAQNNELAAMYNDNATVGSENLAGELPLLKIHTAGRSNSKLADGSMPTDGWFFYKPTGEQFLSITCHILTISAGFRAQGIDEKQNVFNQILAGVTLDNKPFIMYFTGTKLSSLWEFGKNAAKYTHAKPIAIPMFALTVKLLTEQVQTKYGFSWVVKFHIETNPNMKEPFPVLVTDAGEMQYLKDSVLTVSETIKKLITIKSSGADSYSSTHEEEEIEAVF